MNTPLHNQVRAMKKDDMAHHLHPFSSNIGIERDGGPRIINKAQGVWLEDSDGNRIIDGMSGLWCVAVGYSQQRITDAITQQLGELPYYNTFFKTTTPPTVELSKRLASILPDGINTIFYGSSGSESNDTNYRLVHRYWALQGKPDKKWLIARENAYHGSTVLGASLGGMSYMHEQAALPIPYIAHISQPYSYADGETYNDADYGLKKAKELEGKILELGAENVGAFIGEPIQGAGGVIIPPDSYWPEIRRICDKYDVLLISDEVICGFGRTGNWFGCQSMGITPDLMTMAKALTSGYIPLSAVAMRDKVADVLKADEDGFMHGYTYSGHPVACAAALANLDILENDKIIEKIQKETAPHFAKKLAELSPIGIVAETRSTGLIGALEIAKNKDTREKFDGDVGTFCRDICMNNNVVMRGCGDSTMVLAPPLTITVDELDEMFARIEKSLLETETKLLNR